MTPGGPPSPSCSTHCGLCRQTLFSEGRGARPGARRVLVLITDGDATDSDTKSSVRAAEEHGIHRYVIGVGGMGVVMVDQAWWTRQSWAWWTWSWWAWLRWGW